MDRSNVVLVRYSEVAVKGRYTRVRMERLLSRNLLEALGLRGVWARLERAPGRILLWEPTDVDAAVEASARVFGVKSVSPAVAFQFETLEDLVERATEYFAERARGRRFRVTARRSGTHSFTSLDVERLLGARLVEAGAGPVDLTSPEYVAYVEIRGSTAFLYEKIVEGPGGLPLGSEDPVLVLYSGGFDSTATAWLVMRRGSPAGLAYYHMGVREAYENAVKIAKKLAQEWVYGHNPILYLVDFTRIARIIGEKVRPRYRVLVARRLMLSHASRLAEEEGYEALATGESIGQVATQTVRNLRLIGGGHPLPILRPLAGSDKDEVVALVRRIGLYEEVSKQVEACAQNVNPTPRGDPAVFWQEYEKVRGAESEATVVKILLR